MTKKRRQFSPGKKYRYYESIWLRKFGCRYYCSINEGDEAEQLINVSRQIKDFLS